MTDRKQTACSQAAVGTCVSSNTGGATTSPTDSTSRFHGDEVRFKAKLIGVDSVPGAHGDKMCWDSMMKLKGIEAAARKQGKHKQRVWLKLSSGGLKIVDERTGAVQHDHERSRISSLTKDKSDPRALAYVYQQQDTYSLFYIKTANLADPVLDNLKEICERADIETTPDPTETLTQISDILALHENSPSPPEVSASEDLFSPRPDDSSGQTKQSASCNELMSIFTIQLEDPLVPTQNHCNSQQAQLNNVTPESPQQTLSNAQILSMFPSQQPVGVSPYSSPPYCPTTMPWEQQGFLGNQWHVTAVAPWPNMPGNVVAWPPAGSNQAHGSQPGVTMEGGNAIPPCTNPGAAAAPPLLSPTLNPHHSL